MCSAAGWSDELGCSEPDVQEAVELAGESDVKLPPDQRPHQGGSGATQVRELLTSYIGPLCNCNPYPEDPGNCGRVGATSLGKG